MSAVKKPLGQEELKIFERRGMSTGKIAMIVIALVIALIAFLI